MKNRPKLDDLPKNANRRNIKKRMMDELIALSLNCNEQEAKEDLERMLTTQFILMDDKEFQEAYDGIMDIEDRGFE